MSNNVGFDRSSKEITEAGNKDRLVADFQAVVDDAEELLGATANQGGEKLSAVRAKMAERVADAKHKLAAAQHIIVQKTKATAKATDEYVNKNPWQSVLIAAGVGFVVGIITNRLTNSSKS